MSYKVAIRKNETGEVRLYEHSLNWEPHSNYMWAEGNYSCDCNRALFWCRAGNEDDINCPCGDESFTCLYAELPDGSRIQIDD